jgi:hypothetical protein
MPGAGKRRALSTPGAGRYHAYGYGPHTQTRCNPNGPGTKRQQVP